MKKHALFHHWISHLLVLVMLLGPGLSIAEMSASHCHEARTHLTAAVSTDAQQATTMDCCCDADLPCNLDSSCASVCNLLAGHALLPRYTPAWTGLLVDGLILQNSNMQLPRIPSTIERPPRSFSV